MQSLREVDSFGIKKDMNLTELMNVVGNNLHGESTIQITEFKKDSKTNINHQIYDFFPIVEKGDSGSKKIIAGFGIPTFLEIVKQNRRQINDGYEEMLSTSPIEPCKTINTPNVKVDVHTKDYCRFFSLISIDSEIYDEFNSGEFNKKTDGTFPKINAMKYKRFEDTEFITSNIRRERKDHHFDSPNIFAGARTLEDLEALLEYFGKDNFHKVVACNEEQGYALIHKITLKVVFPQPNYFQFSEDSDLKLEVNVEIFHQYFLSGRNDEGGYFITAIVFPDPNMLLDLIRTQDFTPFLTWFNREDQGYKRIQGDILYKIVPEEELKMWGNYDGYKVTFHDIPLDTLYNDYCDLSDPLVIRNKIRKVLMERYVSGLANNNPKKILNYADLTHIEKELMKEYAGEKNFNFSHHTLRSFGSENNKLTNNIQMVSKDRINQYILVTGASRCILQHEQHSARALTIPKDSMLIVSHQRGKDITNLFAD